MKFEVIENVYSDLSKSTLDANQITNEVFSASISQHKMWI